MKRLYDPKRKVCLLHIVDRQASRSAVTIKTFGSFIRENFASLSDEDVRIVFLPSGELGVMFEVPDEDLPLSFEHKPARFLPECYGTITADSGRSHHLFTAHVHYGEPDVSSGCVPLTLFYVQQDASIASVLAAFQKLSANLCYPDAVVCVWLRYLLDPFRTVIVASVRDEDDLLSLDGYQKVESLPNFR